MPKKLILIMALLCLTVPAQADNYTAPTRTSLLQTLIRFKALTLGNDALLDEYAMIAECDLYQTFYRDDFKWHKIRSALVDSMRANVAIYPTAYKFNANAQLDRYNFDKKLYMFNPHSSPDRVNVLQIYKADNGDQCGDAKAETLPSSFVVVLDAPVALTGIPLAQSDAQALLRRMDESGNSNHVLYSQFRMHITYIEPLKFNEGADSNRGHMMIFQGDKVGGDRIKLDAHLDAIAFYSDEAMTQLIYEYVP
jgi:hypothetical protein